jgi:hypothetical protein
LNGGGWAQRSREAPPSFRGRPKAGARNPESRFKAIFAGSDDGCTGAEIE